MKKLASLLLALSLIFGLVSFSYAEEPYEVVIETVTFGAEYADIPAIEEAINAITVPAINVSVKILNVGIPEHAQKISMMIAGGEKNRPGNGRPDNAHGKHGGGRHASPSG